MFGRNVAQGLIQKMAIGVLIESVYGRSSSNIKIHMISSAIGVHCLECLNELAARH